MSGTDTVNIVTSEFQKDPARIAQQALAIVGLAIASIFIIVFTLSLLIAQLRERREYPMNEEGEENLNFDSDREPEGEANAGSQNTDFVYHPKEDDGDLVEKGGEEDDEDNEYENELEVLNRELAS